MFEHSLVQKVTININKDGVLQQTIFLCYAIKDTSIREKSEKLNRTAKKLNI